MRIGYSKVCIAIGGISLALVLSGCASTAEEPQPQMLAVYNATLDNREVRVCKRVATGTRVKKTVCLSQFEWDRLTQASREYIYQNEMEVLR